MKASDWISVKDRLPKDGERVLVCRIIENTKHVEVATRVVCNNYVMWYTDDGFDIEKPTHWMRIVFPKEK